MGSCDSDSFLAFEATVMAWDCTVLVVKAVWRILKKSRFTEACMGFLDGGTAWVHREKLTWLREQLETILASNTQNSDGQFLTVQGNVTSVVENRVEL